MKIIVASIIMGGGAMEVFLVKHAPALTVSVGDPLGSSYS